MSLNRKIIWTGVAILLVVGVGGGFILDADSNSISLAGFGNKYAEAAELALGRHGSSQSSVACGPPHLADFATTSVGAPKCLSITRSRSFAADGCDPVQFEQVVPTYVFAWNDLLEVRLAVSGPNITQVADYLQSFGDQPPTTTSKPSFFIEDPVSRLKSVSATQCDEYGLIDVRQHFFSFNR